MHNTPITHDVTEILKNFFTKLQKQIGGKMLTEKDFGLETNDSVESLREGGDSGGVGGLHNIHYTTKKLFFSGLLRSGKKSGVNKLSGEEAKKYLQKKLFQLWRHLKNNQAQNFINEFRGKDFMGAIRSWGYSLESGVVS